MSDLEPIRATWRRNAERFSGEMPVPADDVLIKWAADCVTALIDLDAPTAAGAPKDPDEYLMWRDVVSGWPLGSVG